MFEDTDRIVSAILRAALVVGTAIFGAIFFISAVVAIDDKSPGTVAICLAGLGAAWLSAALQTMQVGLRYTGVLVGVAAVCGVLAWIGFVQTAAIN